MLRLSLSGLLLILSVLILSLQCPSLVAEVVVIVHPDNGVPALSRHQLRQIFLGRLPLYPHTGHDIVSLDLPEDDPAFDLFYQQVVELQGDKLKRYRAYYLFSGRGKLPVKVDNAQEMIGRVRSEPDAIGYVSEADLEEGVRVLLKLESQIEGEKEREGTEKTKTPDAVE